MSLQAVTSYYDVSTSPTSAINEPLRMWMSDMVYLFIYIFPLCDSNSIHCVYLRTTTSEVQHQKVIVKWATEHSTSGTGGLSCWFSDEETECTMFVTLLQADDKIANTARSQWLEKSSTRGAADSYKPKIDTWVNWQLCGWPAKTFVWQNSVTETAVGCPTHKCSLTFTISRFENAIEVAKRLSG